MMAFLGINGIGVTYTDEELIALRLGFVGGSINKNAEFDALKINAGTWAVFKSIRPFPETLQNVWGRIYSEWFPSSRYEVVEGPGFLWGKNQNIRNPKYRSEIWILATPPTNARLEKQGYLGFPKYYLNVIV